LPIKAPQMLEHPLVILLAAAHLDRRFYWHIFQVLRGRRRSRRSAATLEHRHNITAGPAVASHGASVGAIARKGKWGRAWQAGRRGGCSARAVGGGGHAVLWPALSGHAWDGTDAGVQALHLHAALRFDLPQRMGECRRGAS
jgi:hypothetical protein